MSVANIRARLAAYFDTTVSSFVINGSDVSMAAINAAKDHLQTLIDFVYLEDSSSVVVPLASIDVLNIKRIKAAYLDEERLKPIRFVSRSIAHEDAEIRNGRTADGPWLVQHGRSLQIYRGQAGTTVYLDVIKWHPDYSDNSPQDWFLRHCHEAIFWHSVISLNHIFKEFVWRQEGNLQPPERLFDTAYAAVVEWNARVIDQSQL